MLTKEEEEYFYTTATKYNLYKFETIEDILKDKRKFIAGLVHNAESEGFITTELETEIYENFEKIFNC